MDYRDETTTCFVERLLGCHCSCTSLLDVSDERETNGKCVETVPIVQSNN